MPSFDNIPYYGGRNNSDTPTTSSSTRRRVIDGNKLLEMIQESQGMRSYGPRRVGNNFSTKMNGDNTDLAYAAPPEAIPNERYDPMGEALPEIVLTPEQRAAYAAKYEDRTTGFWDKLSWALRRAFRPSDTQKQELFQEAAMSTPDQPTTGYRNWQLNRNVDYGPYRAQLINEAAMRAATAKTAQETAESRQRGEILRDSIRNNREVAAALAGYVPNASYADGPPVNAVMGSVLDNNPNSEYVRKFPLATALANIYLTGNVPSVADSTKISGALAYPQISQLNAAGAPDLLTGIGNQTTGQANLMNAQNAPYLANVEAAWRNRTADAGNADAYARIYDADMRAISDQLDAVAKMVTEGKISPEYAQHVSDSIRMGKPIDPKVSAEIQQMQFRNDIRKDPAAFVGAGSSLGMNKVDSDLEGAVSPVQRLLEGAYAPSPPIGGGGSSLDDVSAGLAQERILGPNPRQQSSLASMSAQLNNANAYSPNPNAPRVNPDGPQGAPAHAPSFSGYAAQPVGTLEALRQENAALLMLIEQAGSRSNMQSGSVRGPVNMPPPPPQINADVLRELLNSGYYR